MIFFQLNQYIPVQNLYGAGTISKHRCFNKIRGDFPRNKITVIADGSEEESLSKEVTGNFFWALRLILFSSDFIFIKFEVQEIWLHSIRIIGDL